MPYASGSVERLLLDNDPQALVQGVSPDRAAAIRSARRVSRCREILAVAALAAGCLGICRAREVESGRPEEGMPEGNARWQERVEMVRAQLEAQGIKDPAVLKAMREVPRHAFVPESLQDHAYEDRPLHIGDGQTISQPFIVALMTELARLGPGERVLEVGTGSGYQAAVLERMNTEVFTIEIVPTLARHAEETLDALGYTHIRFRTGDGYRGWPEAAPFDAVIVTAAPRAVPQPLVDQLKIGGRLVIPVGDAQQTLVVLTRTSDGIRREEIAPVRFVPMTGEAQHPVH